MKVKIMENGPISTFLYTRSGMENLNRLIFLAFIAGLAIIISLFGIVAPTEDIMVNVIFFATAAFTLLFAIFYLWISKLRNVIIDRNDRTCTVGSNVYNIPDSSTIFLDRNYTIVGGGKSRRQAVVWTISIKDIEGNEQSIYSYTGNGNQFSCPWIDETAETIAEILQVTLEDNTGHDLEIRHPGETDTSFVELLKQRGVDIGETTPAIPLELQDRLGLEFTDNGFEIFTVHKPISLVSYVKVITGLILAGIGVTFDLIVLFFGLDLMVIALPQFDDNAGPIMIALFYITMALALVTIFALINLMTLFFGILLLTSLKGTTFIDFKRVSYGNDKKEIHLREKGLIITKNRGKMSMDSVEKLITVQKWTEEYTVEFVGDDKRLQLPGEYNLDEAALLEDLITHILVQMG